MRSGSLIVLGILLAATTVAAQSVVCSNQPPVVSRTAEGWQIDPGWCFVFPGSQPAGTAQTSWTVSLGGASQVLGVGVTYTSPDTFAIGTSVQLCNSDCSELLRLPPMSWTGPGTGVAERIDFQPVNFAGGVRAVITMTGEIGDYNSQCFAFGYYCYWSGVVTVRGS